MANQHFVVVAGNNLYRYEGSRRIEHARLGPTDWEQLTVAERKELVEDFRKNGLPPDAEAWPAAQALHVAQHEMQNKRPLEGYTLDELLKLWDRIEDCQFDDAAFIDGHRVEDVWLELHNRGIKKPRG